MLCAERACRQLGACCCSSMAAQQPAENTCLECLDTELHPCACAWSSPPSLAVPRRFAPHTRRMKLHHAWWSRKEAAVKVTIVTGLNPSRVNQLESQCNSYKGPISAAVYVVLHNPDANAALTAEHKQQLAEAQDVLDKFHKR